MKQSRFSEEQIIGILKEHEKENLMEKIVNRYLELDEPIQVFVRDKMVEGKIKDVESGIVHLVGDKYEFFIPLENILFVGSKLVPEKQKQRTVGF